MREDVLRNLASYAVTDPTFLRQARQDLQGTLARHGYRLTDEETRLVEGLRRQTDSMTDGELARTLASGLEGRTGSPPARPAAPSWRGSGPARPARPGSQWQREQDSNLRPSGYERKASYQTAPPASPCKPRGERYQVRTAWVVMLYVEW